MTSRSSPRLHSFERASRLIGDHWTLLIVRELTLNHSLSFTELHVALRGISTNILSHRLHQLVSQQLLTVNQCRADGRKQFSSGGSACGRAAEANLCAQAWLFPSFNAKKTPPQLIAS